MICAIINRNIFKLRKRPEAIILMDKSRSVSAPFIFITNTVVFPGTKFSFIATEKNDTLSLRAADRNDRKIFLLPDFYNDDDKTHRKISDVACLAEIDELNEVGDDAYNVTVTAIRRASVDDISIFAGTQILYATFPENGESAIADEEAKEIKSALIGAAKTNVDIFKPRFPAVPKSVFDVGSSIDTLCDKIAAYIIITNENKEEIYEEIDVRKRTTALLEALEAEAEILTIERELMEKVRDNLNNNQKNAFLREQMRVIKQELGEEEQDEIEELYDKIEASSLSDESKSKLQKELRRMSYFNPGSPDYALAKGYIETCLELPIGVEANVHYDTKAPRKILDDDHDGLTEIKDRIIEFLSVANLKPDAPLQILCLVGPPGTGKTSVAKSVATAMGRKFVRVSLGGVRDESDIRGHRKTYVGAMPGRIINAFLQAKAQDPVILLDEIDKMGQSHNGDPAAALLEVLDMEQNHSFRDHYIEIPYDLSNALFITTANTLSTVPRPLLDRMEVIELHSYSRSEKLSIAKHHLIPKQLLRHGVKKQWVSFTDKAVLEIIDSYTKEAGVRNLEREIASVIRKCAVRIGDEPDHGKISVKVSNLEEFLGPKKILADKIDKKAAVGITNGLAYTEVGGDLLKIEALTFEGSGKLELTGSLGDVMKESARIAISNVRALCDEYGIDKDFHKTRDIHGHVPEGAVPKDGPSAGVTLTTTLISALTGLPVRGDIAMTGEITLTGRVLPIGGLKEKSMAALSNGISTILIPKDNLAETKKFDSSLKDAITYIPCERIDDVLSVAIVRN